MVSRICKGHKLKFIVSSVLTCIQWFWVDKILWFGHYLKLYATSKRPYMIRVVLYQCT